VKLTIRSFLFFYLLLLAFGLLPVYAGAADGSRTVMDMVPYDSLAYVSVSDLDVVRHSVMESPEWEELMGIEQIAEQIDQARQALNFGPMLIGISIEDFVGAFGHNMVLTFMGLQGSIPMAGLILDPGDYMEQLEYAIEQTATIPALTGGAMVEEKKYRDVPYTAVGNQAIKVKYAFLDNFLVAGIGGGFEKLVDFHKGGGESIKDSQNYQFMKKKVSLSSEICVYADLERAAPMLEMIAAAQSGEQENPINQMIMQVALNSVKAFALSLSFSGHTQEMYLHLRPEEPDPITDLLLAPYVPMSAAGLVPVEDGAMVAIHIGDPAELLDKGMKLAESFGQDMAEVKAGMQQLKDGMGLDIKDDLLSALTGEFAVATMLPQGPIDLNANKLQLAMQIAKVRQVVLIGVKDEKKLRKTFQKLTEMIEIKTLPLDERSYKGSKIVTHAVPMDVLFPGVALIPAYSFRDNVLIMSNKAEWVMDAIDLLESSSPELRQKLSESRILVSLDAGGLADFAVEQGFAEEINLSEEIQDKARSLGSVAANFSLSPDGAGIKLISTSEDNWATKILRGALIAVYVNVEKQEQIAREMEEAAEMEIELEKMEQEEGTEDEN